MKLKLLRLMPLVVILAMGLMLIPMASVHAQAVVSVSPNAIVNNVATIITVSGTGFDATAKILLDGVELPGTVFVDVNNLQVTVPAGVAVGSHIITISQAGAGGSAALNVSAPLPPLPTATTAPLPFARPQFVVRVSKAVGKV